MNAPIIHRSWLEDVSTPYGPSPLIGDFLLAADGAAVELGVHLSFVDCHTLQKTNEANLDHWYPLLPPLDAARADLNPDRFFCLVGRDSQNAIVATIAGRMYHWTDTNLAQEANSHRFFYDDPDNTLGPKESCILSAPSAQSIDGNVIYIGAAWYRPDHRKRGLPRIFSRIARVYALGRWNADYAIGFMKKGVLEGGLMSQTGHRHSEWGLDWQSSPIGDVHMALVWITAAETLEDATIFRAELRREKELAAHQRRA